MKGKTNWLFWFWLVAVAAVVVVAFTLAGTVTASGQYDATFAPTLTAGAWGTPTPYITNTPRSAIPCTAAPTTSATAMWGIGTFAFPTANLGTPISTYTPAAKTSTPAMPNTFKVKVDMVNSGSPGLHGANQYMLCWDDVSGSQTQITMADGGGTSSTTITAHTVECLGNFAVSDTNHNWTRYLDIKFSLESSSQSNLPVYTSYDFNIDGVGTHTGEGEGYGNFTLSTTLWSVGGDPKVIYGNGVSGSANMYVYFMAQEFGFDIVPTPFVRATDVPCVAAPDYSGGGTPVASFPAITYQYGGCTTIIPGVNIPLAGFLGLPDINTPGFGMCIMWVTIVASFLSISLDWVLTPLIILGFGFAIFNEFRS